MKINGFLEGCFREDKLIFDFWSKGLGENWDWAWSVSSRSFLYLFNN